MRLVRSGLLPLLCLALAGAPAAAGEAIAVEHDAAANPADPEARARRGAEWLERAKSGSEEAIGRAVAEFDAVLAARPGDALSRVQRGAALLLYARHAPMTEKLGWARRGLAEMETAVAAAPEDAAVRLVRATNASVLPRMLDCTEQTRRDFAWLLTRARAGNEPLPPGLRRAIFFHAGAFALKERQPAAVALLEEALAVQAPEPTDERVQSMLALAREQITPHPHADFQAPNRPSPP